MESVSHRINETPSTDIPCHMATPTEPGTISHSNITLNNGS